MMDIEYEDIIALRSEAATTGNNEAFAICCVALGEADEDANREAGHIGQDDAWWECVDIIENNHNRGGEYE
jgi:hypothetical protein